MAETEYQERRKYFSWCRADGVQGAGRNREGIEKGNKIGKNLEIYLLKVHPKETNEH